MGWNRDDLYKPVAKQSQARADLEAALAQKPRMSASDYQKLRESLDAPRPRMSAKDYQQLREFINEKADANSGKPTTTPSDSVRTELPATSHAAMQAATLEWLGPYMNKPSSKTNASGTWHDDDLLARIEDAELKDKKLRALGLPTEIRPPRITPVQEMKQVLPSPDIKREEVSQRKVSRGIDLGL